MINTEIFKSKMEEINNRILEEKKLLTSKGISTKGVSEDDDIDHLVKKTSDTSFKLLVMGRFSSGKSAFVNVLLGERLLSENALPTTALITEVYYGTKKKVTMYPREGKWKGGNAPFEIEPTLEEIKKYSTIDNMAGGLNSQEANRIDSMFEKMVVEWPLEMLKDGVSIIDSPGTDDPFQNDYIVESYVPKADAILYCISGLQAYDMKDKTTLDRLNSLGHRPIIVTTYFDFVTSGLSESEKQDFINVTSQHYVTHTSRKSCHYVNSKLGLKAKINNSHADYVESGYFELEKFLGEYLSENRGKEKIGIATAATKLFNNAQIKRINSFKENLDAPMHKFDEKVAEAEKNLKNAEERGNLIMREYNAEAKIEKLEIYKMIPTLFDDLYNDITLDDFTPATNFSMWHPKKCSEAMTEECSKEIEIRKKALIEKWTTEKFVPAMTRSFQNINKKMETQISDFGAAIQKAHINVNASGKYENTSSEFTKAAMTIANFATGGILTAIGGGVYGFGGLARNIVCQIAVQIALMIAAEFTPIGWAATLAAAVTAALIGGKWNAYSMSQKIKNVTVSEMRKALLNEKERMIQSVENQCDNIFDDNEKKLKSAIKEDIDATQKIIEETRNERAKNQNNIDARKAELAEVLAFIIETDAQMDGIRKDLGLQDLKVNSK